jgi:hypothetical protein
LNEKEVQRLKIIKDSDEKANLIGTSRIKLNDEETYLDQGDAN